jgi:hypothetical protein
VHPLRGEGWGEAFTKCDIFTRLWDIKCDISKLQHVCIQISHSKPYEEPDNISNVANVHQKFFFWECDINNINGKKTGYITGSEK